jgi:hypothetical protein
MASFKKTVAAAKAKVVKAETEAFMARLEAINSIVDGADPNDIMQLCAHVLAHAAPLCCEPHQDEFQAEFLRMLGDCLAMEHKLAQEQQQEPDAEPDDDGDAPPRVH